MSFFKKSIPNKIISDEFDKKSLKQQVEELKNVINNPDELEKHAKETKKFQKFMNKEKKFKIPSKVINKVKKEYKKNKVLVVLLRMNRAIDFIVAQQVAGMVFIDGTPHQASVDFTFIYNKLPVLVIPEWNLSPIGTKDYYDAKKEGATSEPSTIILRAIEAKEAMQQDKKKMNFGSLIWIFIGAAAIIGLFLMNKK